MRKMFFPVFWLLMSMRLFSQQTVPPHSSVQTGYLAKSEKQKRAGWIMLGTGAVMMAVGIPLMAHGQRQEGFMAGFGEELGGFALTVGGGALSLSSIFPFAASARNRKRATTVGLKMESGNAQPYQQGFVRTSFPALHIRVAL